MKKLILIALAFAGLNVSASNQLSVKPIVNQPNCNGANTGDIALSVQGGSAPYSYLWSNGSSTNSISSLPAGSYQVTVTDNNGESVATTVIVAQPFAIALNTSASNVSQHGGTDGCIHLSVDGGTPDYTYQWSNNSNVQSPCGLPAGTYTVTVTDAFGCTATASKTIYQPSHVTYNNQFNNPSELSYVSSPNNGTHGQTRMDLTGTDNNAAQIGDKIEVYPNPATNVINLNLGVTNAEVSMFNILGQNVKQIKAETAETSLDISNLPKGNYLLVIKTETGSFNKVVTVTK
ncbi:MAG TPA: T9SS type A sorting domain-containing protein [Chitinophagales bacterium]|nr:T9SS type A sorting domain-containing protein [Chitinophagales bacterium]